MKRFIDLSEMPKQWNIELYPRKLTQIKWKQPYTILSIDTEDSDELLKDPTALALEVFAYMKNSRIQFQI